MEKQLQESIVKAIKYFTIFAYHPTLKEIHTFLQVKISKNSLNIELNRMNRLRIINKYKIKNENTDRYTVGEYDIKKIKNLELKIKNSKKKLNDWWFRLYTKLILIFPQIKLVGLSGSISMMNAEKNDDIDLFIITAKNRLFTGRLISLVLAQILGLRRKRDQIKTQSTKRKEGEDSCVIKNNHDSSKKHKYKVCLNLFFDESNLKVPKFKQTEFVGHEVLQMRPIIDKQGTYEHFLKANKWVISIFPNTVEFISNIKNQRSQTKPKFKTLIFKLGFNLGTLIFDLFEKVSKKLQLTSINHHRTTEIITPTQLWFHPDDFEKKIKY
jgi:hypothetical protein